MAETKMKNGVNGVNGTKPSFKGTKLYETLRNMISSANAVNSELSNLPDLEKLMESEKRLRKEVEDKNKEVENIRKEKEKLVEDKSKEMDQLMKDMDEQVRLVREEKDKEISSLKAKIKAEEDARTVLIRGFEKRVGEYNHTEAENVLTNQRLAEVQQNLQTKEGEVATARQQVAELEQSSTRSSAEVKSLTAEKDKVILEKNLLSADLHTREAELQIVESDLQQLQKDVGVNLLQDYTDRDLDKFRRELDTYAEESRALVTEFFRESDNTLVSLTLIHNEAMLKSQNAVHLPHLEYLKRVPLPKSGSSAELRCIVAQAVIANFLRSHIFQPFFLPPKYDGAGQDILEYLSEDMQHATIFRGQILAACDRNGTGKVVANQAKDEAYRELCPLVPATKYIPLQQRLTKFFEDGVQMWSHMQRSRQLMLCEDLENDDVDDVDESQRTRFWEEYGPRAKAAGGAKGEVVAELFPYVVLEESEETINVLHPGVGLWSDQGVVLAAQQALMTGQANGRVNGDGTRPPNSRRRSSSSAPSGRA